ncbi:helix-turn-helix domain-containing protein [Streptomyces mirabilis]|uniref:helix-turn-helix domain-containing protein n=1 Tax=Streptomyces mirabilis TaxID=68239 RepID=UPI003667E494
MDTEDYTPDALLQEGLRRLADLLGPTWNVGLRPVHEGARGVDALVELKPEGDGTFTQLLVELKRSVTPRMIEEVLLPRVDLLRQVNHYTNLLVMAPWLSLKTQQMLRQHDISYLDLTGNVSLRVTRPAIVIYTEGATRAPRAMTSGQSRTTLAGPKAGRLVRLLAEVRPPYRAGELAQASGLSLAYVSRLLDTLGDQLLIRRDGRTITDVDWPNLLRARAEQAVLLKSNTYTGMLAPNGVESVLMRLRTLPPSEFDGVAVTGSYAAHDVAPLSAGGQLMLYVAPRLGLDDLSDDLGLLRVQENADVLLLRPPDDVVFEGTRDVMGIQHVALSQLALDCLSGPGRMPAEGEAVLEYMSRDEGQWRGFAISDLRRRPHF